MVVDSHVDGDVNSHVDGDDEKAKTLQSSADCTSAIGSLHPTKLLLYIQNLSSDRSQPSHIFSVQTK